MINKKVQDGQWTLEYIQYVDSFGFIKDMYSLKEHIGDRYKCYPMLVPMKVKDYTPDTNVMDSSNEPTEAEMLTHLRERVKHIETST